VPLTIVCPLRYLVLGHCWSREATVVKIRLSVTLWVCSGVGSVLPRYTWEEARLPVILVRLYKSTFSSLILQVGEGVDKS